MKKKKMVIVEIEPGSAHRAPQDTTPHNSHVCVAGFMQFSGPAMQYVILLYFSQNSNTQFGILYFLLLATRLLQCMNVKFGFPCV